MKTFLGIEIREWIAIIIATILIVKVALYIVDHGKI